MFPAAMPWRSSLVCIALAAMSLVPTAQSFTSTPTLQLRHMERRVAMARGGARVRRGRCRLSALQDPRVHLVDGREEGEEGAMIEGKLVPQMKRAWKPWTEVEIPSWLLEEMYEDRTFDARTHMVMGEKEKEEEKEEEDRAKADSPYISEVFLKEGGLERFLDEEAKRVKGTEGGMPFPAMVVREGRIEEAARGEVRGGEERRRRARSGGRLFAKDFLTYSPSEIKAYYDRNPIPVLVRLLEVGVPVGKWLLNVALDLLMSRKGKELRKQRARELRRVLADAGPTSIKIGQALSNRPDVVPAEYMEELQQLQDNVGAFATEEAMAIIEEESGRSVEELFEFFSPEPVASASLGQVYRARLHRGAAGAAGAAGEGRDVAVKVQRPGLTQTMPIDMYILRGMAGVAKRSMKLRSDLSAILDEFAERLFEEVDYRQEARNARRFKELYGEISGLVVPEVEEELCTRRVMVMEWIEGAKPPWAETQEERRKVTATEEERKNCSMMVSFMLIPTRETC
ncbi:ABC-1 like protein kinase [Guillardia theta CCMP2712]|uniref:ABC-1 like protein kinase n=1 Tax=Guillardia theta (strain CCMP2712) TaxID=905079 RepID=L1IY06_GUITC|nr:ABC-1 like protein kinase [Guillardia theta CCMP2712]EKX40759.1 ABC-1 like protein kinase [Guillardia theta CCMP2712]|eukprot:XP_005827739.1 ABC-1 like protein kinase [Guillardia theta CCMP2712]